MSDVLSVHLNRTELYDLDVPGVFETDDTFVVELVNHGEPVHVHLNLDGALSEVATLEATNHYVEAESRRSIEVVVRQDQPVRGKLKVASGYGSRTHWIDVVITEPPEAADTVEVDESLSKPRSKPTPDGDSSSAVGPTLPVLALGAVAIVLAVVAAVTVGGTAVTVGAGAVVVAVLAAVAYLSL